MSEGKPYYQIGKKLGLNEEEINNVLKSNSSLTKHPKIETGPRPPMYTSSFYGSVSIKDF